MIKIDATLRDVIEMEVRKSTQIDTNINITIDNDGGDLIKETRVLCHHCTRKIHDLPLGLPYSLRGNDFLCTGYFCSFKCANTYLQDYLRYKSDFDNRQYLLRYLYKIVTGRDDDIGTVPSKEVLIRYGGELTDEEYEEYVTSDEKIKYITSTPPLVHHIQPIVSFGIDKKTSTCSSLPQNGIINLQSLESKAFTLTNSCTGKQYRVQRY